MPDRPAGTAPPVVLVPYDAAWRERASRLARDLCEALGPAALHVDHIGSTAIPGMAAKPVLDLQVRVADLDLAAAAFAAPLAERGFERRPFDRDHAPAGLPDAPSEWAKRYWSRPGPGDPVHLHVRVAGAANARFALLFRDWLRAHPAAVAAYSRFKRDLAGSVTDRDAYTDVKDSVVDVVVAAGEAWAARTGWTPPAPGGDTGGSGRPTREPVIPPAGTSSPMPTTWRCELFPADLDATIAFYVDVLAFELVRDERDAEAPYIVLLRGGLELGAAKRPEVADRAPRRPPAGVELVLEVDDLDAERDRVAAAGWPIAEDVQQRAWDLRDFRLLDPSGYYWRITTRAYGAGTTHDGGTEPGATGSGL